MRFSGRGWLAAGGVSRRKALLGGERAAAGSRARSGGVWLARAQTLACERRASGQTPRTLDAAKARYPAAGA